VTPHSINSGLGRTSAILCVLPPRKNYPAFLSAVCHGLAQVVPGQWFAVGTACSKQWHTVACYHGVVRKSRIPRERSTGTASPPQLESGRTRQLPSKEAAERTARADDARKSILSRSAWMPQSDRSNRRRRRTRAVPITLATRNRTLAGGLRNFLGLVQTSFQLNLDRSADSHQLMILKSMQTSEKSVHAVAS
jgi:hypothetical protein